MARKSNKAKQATHVPSVALLIDGENALVPDLIDPILVEAGKMGVVTSRQVYGNWAASCMQGWKNISVRSALEPKGHLLSKPGHNGTDIALAIGAMDLFHQEGIKSFCIVAGDSDYVPLVLRLRQGGSRVLVIAPPACSSVLKEASSVFLSTDQLLPQASSQPASSQVVAPSIPSELSELLTKAYHVATQKSKTEWVLLSVFGSALRQLAPDFQAKYGKQKLSTLIKQHPMLFEFRHRIRGNGQVQEVRLLSST
jgi:NYN domain/OST-HTH/LOTUS domain